MGWAALVEVHLINQQPLYKCLPNPVHQARTHPWAEGGKGGSTFTGMGVAYVSNIKKFMCIKKLKRGNPPA
jgi:hypothetical protein